MAPPYEQGAIAEIAAGCVRARRLFPVDLIFVLGLLIPHIAKKTRVRWNFEFKVDGYDRRGASRAAPLKRNES